MNEKEELLDDKEIREMYKANVQAAAPDMGRLWSRIEAAVDAAEQGAEASEGQQIRPSRRRESRMRLAAAAAAFVLVAGAGAVWYKLYSSVDSSRAPMNNEAEISSSAMTEAAGQPEESDNVPTRDPLQNSTNHLGANKDEENDGIDNIHTNDQATENTQSKVEYTYERPDWEPYLTVEDMMSQSDTVLVARVTDISFAAHEDSSEGQSGKELWTVYGLEVLEVCKGDAEKSIRLRMRGGLEDSTYESEQAAALGGKPVTEITVYAGQPTLEAGQTYLLVLHKDEGSVGYYRTVGYSQGVYPLDRDAANGGGDDFTAEEIMSFFGEDKWAELEESRYLGGAE